MTIHPTAVISPHAQLGHSVWIGPFCSVEGNAVVGDHCVLEARCSIKPDTVLGEGNRVGEGAILGGLPQHLKMGPEVGGVRIGSGNQFRENVTINRALKPGQETFVGSQCLLMTGTHVAHDCVLGNHIVMANNSSIAGHCVIADRVFISAYVGVHQFCRIGRSVMVGAFAKVIKDIPPFVLVDGNPCYTVGLNTVGLRRAGFTSDQLKRLKAAYAWIYRSGLPWDEMLRELAIKFPTDAESEFHPFFTSGGSRGFTPERRMPPNATLKIRPTEESAPASDGPASAPSVRAEGGLLEAKAVEEPATGFPGRNVKAG